MNKPKQNTPIQSEKSKRGSELESLLYSEHIVEIEKLIVGGEGLARLQFKDKSLVVFVPRSAPGDKLKIKIIHAEKNHLQGQITEIITPSKSRQQPFCEYFNNCGGCSWQHVSVAEQIQQKEQILTDLLKKFIPNINYTLLPIVKSEKNSHYRNRIQLKWQNGLLGYFKKGSHQIVDIDHCPISEEEISKEIKPLKQKLKISPDLKKYELRINHLNKFEHYEIGRDGEGLSFSQVNNNVNENLVAATLSIIEKIKPAFVTELYAGAGNFTFPLLSKLPDTRMESVELNPKLTAFATQKLLAEKLQKRLNFFTADCESFIARRSLSKQLVLLDPPRSGCSPIVVEKIANASPNAVVYISCHPVNLVRDLKVFLSSNVGYTIEHLQIFDMFPQTDHFETLVVLVKN